jgi:hypothetical protein
LIGHTFLLDKQGDGQVFRGIIVELIEDHESKVEDNPTRIKFKVSVNDEQIVHYARSNNPHIEQKYIER